MDGYLLDTNHLVPLLREHHPHRAAVLKGLATAAADAPVYVATATLAELEVGCCFGQREQSEAQAEIRQVISGNKLDVGLERLVKEGYAITFHPNASETIYSITTKGWAALHEAEGND